MNLLRKLNGVRRLIRKKRNAVTRTEEAAQFPVAAVAEPETAQDLLDHYDDAKSDVARTASEPATDFEVYMRWRQESSSSEEEGEEDNSASGDSKAQDLEHSRLKNYLSRKTWRTWEYLRVLISLPYCY